MAGDSVCSLELELVEGSVCAFVFVCLWFGLNIYSRQNIDTVDVTGAPFNKPSAAYKR